ncbi:MAG TPA: cytochrome c maturation protein CcmE [Stellaceae bacterium]|nr:cytochrome c maturation protein CcmE [Stellaceae bacterium]
MTRKRRRLVAVLLGLAMLALATTLVLLALSANDSLAFFTSPSELKAHAAPEGRRLRLGGLVETASLAREADGKTVHFRVTDGANGVAVTYGGALPDLFREGQGVVVEGKLDRGGTLVADTVLAKHDENYMPREVVEALKKSGHWQEGAAGPARQEGAAR